MCYFLEEFVLKIYIQKLLSLLVLSFLFSLSLFCEEVEKLESNNENLSNAKIEKNGNFHAGNLHSIFNKKGALNLFYDSHESNFEIPLLSQFDDAMTSYFSVVIGNKEYKSNSNAVTKKIRYENGDCCFDFYVKNKFFSTLQLSSVDNPLFVKAELDETPEKVLKIDYFVTNNSPKNQKIVLKAFFDTILGENSQVHFFTGVGTEIENEKQFSADELKKEVFIESSNKKYSQKFIFGDYPSYLTVANKDTLLKMLKSNHDKPQSSTGRSFSSASSYSNSALTFNWAEIVIAPGYTKKVTFYISASKILENVSNIRFVKISENDENILNDTFIKEPVVDAALSENDNVDFIVPPIEEYQLNPDYVQKLITKINAIQSGTEKPKDNNEIKRLNAELDAILTELKKQN